MAAKATTPEQAAAFHQAQIGHAHCFNGCCLHEAIERAEQAERKLNILRRQVCTCGFTDFDEPNAHHPECNYRITMLNAVASQTLDQAIDEVGEAGGIQYERS